MAPTVNLGLYAELKVGDTPIKFSLETAGGDTSLFTGSISSTSPIRIKELISAFDSDLATSIPEDIKITLDELLLILAKEAPSEGRQASTTLVIRLGLGAAINLSNLPLVGKEFSGDRTLAIESFKVLYSSKQFTPGSSIQELFTPNDPQTGTASIPEGLRLSAAMKFGTDSQVLDIAISKSKSQTLRDASLPRDDTPINNGIREPNVTRDSGENSEDPPVPTTDTVKWFDLKKNFGPLYFSRVGVQYQNSEVWFLLDASISAAGLTLTLNGLAVGSPITQFKPKFNLRGLGIEYDSKGALSIAGALLRTTTNGKDTYAGAVIVKTETFTLSALASYTTTDDGHPSLFVYGVLDKPLGGPPFFFVTGLALGFAYNRSLILPTLDQIPQFPLVRAAMGEQSVKGLIEIQQALEPYIPPKTGQVMLAIGVKFTSFKIIESFILLVATFGEQFALDVIGISTLTSPPVPPGVDASTLPPPIAQIRLAILARFVPAEGTLKVDGKILPDSFLFERNCQISGGFAFYSWFKGEHEGDFVLTVGGYHPRFAIPAHYPKVDPLSLNWRLNNELTIKGSVYFALTASAIMAGGRLEAVWQSGNLKAWFIANADFIVAWKPYFYDAQISVRVGASYTFDEKILGIRVRKTFSFDIGASVHIWGPEFSGTATIDLKITSFTIAFGNRTQQRPAPISWQDFKQSFLPAQDQICAIAVENGLLRKLEGSEVVIVNPRHFILTTSSVIPIQDKPNQQVGIAPMGVTKQKFTSALTLNLKQNGQDKNINDFFNKIPIDKNVPSGLWAESNSNEPNRPGFIENVLSGYTLQPKNQTKPGETQAIDRDKLAYDQTSVEGKDQWQSFFEFKKNDEQDENKRQQHIQTTLKNAKSNREVILKSLELSSSDIDLTDLEDKDKVEQAFVISPQLEALIV